MGKPFLLQDKNEETLNHLAKYNLAHFRGLQKILKYIIFIFGDCTLK